MTAATPTRAERRRHVGRHRPAAGRLPFAALFKRLAGERFLTECAGTPRKLMVAVGQMATDFSLVTDERAQSFPLPAAEVNAYVASNHMLSGGGV